MVTNVENIKKNFGFGCMRLPMNGSEVDTEETCRMVDAFLEAGLIILIRHTDIYRERVSWR